MFAPFSQRAKEWEPIALALRRLLRLGPAELLDPWKLAPKVGLRLLDGTTALSLVCEDDREHLQGDGSDSWSGGVFALPLPDGTFVCILNPRHSQRRNKITLMEEIVHRHRAHAASQLVLSDDDVAVRKCDPQQEEEAYGIGAAALLPWITFFADINGGQTAEEIAEKYEVTQALVEYRIKITGAFTLYRARQRRRA